MPVEVVGASGLLDRPEIVDLVSWLEVLADPAASVALLRILAGPRYRIGLKRPRRPGPPRPRVDSDSQLPKPDCSTPSRP